MNIYTNIAAAATATIIARAVRVFGLSCINSNAATRYVQLWASTTAVQSGSTVPVLSFQVPANSMVVLDKFFSDLGVAFPNGVAFGFSTTRDVYTAGASGDQFTTVIYA